MPAKQHVVVVGGGGAGAKLARALSAKLDPTKYHLILVSAHPFFVHYVAGIRTIVTDEGALEDKILIPYDKLFINNNGRFKQGTVTAIEAKEGSHKGGQIFLDGGETIDYDVLALAPGSRWESFLNLPYDGEKVQAHINEWREKFRSAKNVVIAGGGAVGIELAGELREFYPKTKVTIVHAGKKLLNATYPDKFRLDVERRVRANKIRLILGDYIDSFPATATRKGIPLDADLVVSARGPRPNTSFIASSLGSDTLNENNLVRIRPTMQLMSYPNIFALGDIIDFAEQKQVAKYEAHANVVAANVLNVLTGTELTKKYKGSMEAIFITAGKNGGAGYLHILWGLMFGNWIVSFAKSKGLFISMTRKTLGQLP